jgi:phytoene desaturase
MAEKSIIIIGAGLAGLAAGCYAQMNGYRTRIFEQHTRPGGVCTAWKRKGYTIDGCIHWLMGSRPGCAFYELYREVGALEGNRLIPLDHLARSVDQASGQSLDITADLDRLAADMRVLSPGDGPLIDELMTVVRAFQGFDPPANVPQELMGPLAGLQQTWQMRRWLKELRRYNVPVAEFAGRFHDPFLRWAVANVFVPEMPMTLLCILLAQLADGKLATVEGSSLEFALAVARRYVELGGQIVYGEPVQEILVEEAGRKRDRAIGVRMEGGTEHRADVVISAADGHSTLFAMLGGRYADLETRSRYETWPLFPPIVTVSYGVGRAYPGHPTGNMVRLEQPLSIAGQAVEHLSCRVYQGPTFALPGKAVVQAAFKTDFDYWNDLQQADRARYDAEKARVAGQVLGRLESFLPGISAAVEMRDVATPYTLHRYTRNYRGASEGWLITPDNVGKPLPRTLPGLENFYMAGQWVEPGGGVPTVLGSGRQAVQLVCHHDKAPFTVENV